MMKNSKNSILLVDPEFDPATAPDCSLLLKITGDSFSYAIIDKNNKQLKAVFDQQECEDISFSLALALKQDNYLGLPFRDIKTSVYTRNTIAIPDELYAEDDLNSYAKFFTEEQSGNLYVQPFAKYGFTAIFNLQQFIEDTLDLHMADAKRFEQNAPVLALAAAAGSSSFLLDFTVGSVNVLLQKDGKLVFQNTFDIENAQEFHYYLALLIQELLIDTGIEVLMSGMIHENDDYHTCISSYFNHTTFNLPPANDIEKAILEDMPAHYYSSLLALDLCV
ncbi:DUF3822 family protein [Pedobacter sp. AW31-3R]|uniref:DUF3822 family protein n=1 Tax=Pedobacter sp. AW31-3R TaxID=3445781 RepID=UPI003F9FD130